MQSAGLDMGGNAANARLRLLTVPAHLPLSPVVSRVWVWRGGERGGGHGGDDKEMAALACTVYTTLLGGETWYSTFPVFAALVLPAGGSSRPTGWSSMPNI